MATASVLEKSKNFLDSNMGCFSISFLTFNNTLETYLPVIIVLFQEMNILETDNGETVVEFESHDELKKYYNGSVLKGRFCPFCEGFDTVEVDASSSTCDACDNHYQIQTGGLI